MIKETKLGGLQAVIYTPDGYQHLPGNPVWLFAPGRGQVLGIENLYVHNLLGHIRQGARPNFVFIAVSPGQVWFMQDPLYRAVMDVRAMFPGCKLVGNGLSLGGWTWVNYVNSGSKYADLVDGLVIMSANKAGTDNLQVFAGKPVLGYATESEPPEIYYSHPGMMDAFRAAGAIVKTGIIPASGHGGWDKIYAWPGEMYDTMHELLIGGRPAEPEEPQQPERKLLTTIKVYTDGHIEKIQA